MAHAFLSAKLDPILQSSPYIAEQLAIDLTNAPLAAERELREFRERPLLRCFWDSITGGGRELLASAGTNLVIAQKATVNVVMLNASALERVERCQERVVKNLYRHEALLGAQEERLRALETSNAVYRLHHRYDDRTLDPGMGQVLGAALYLAQLSRLLAGYPADLHGETNHARASIERQLGRKPQTLSAQLVEGIRAIRADALEPAAYIASRGSPGPLMRAFRRLVVRRMHDQDVIDQQGEEALTYVKQWPDKGGHLRHTELLPYELIEFLKDELVQAAGCQHFLDMWYDEMFCEDLDAQIEQFAQDAVELCKLANYIEEKQKRDPCPWLTELANKVFQEVALLPEQADKLKSLKDLDRQIGAAIAEQDFEKASHLRDQTEKLKALKALDPRIAYFRQEQAAAVAEKDFEKAARFRDQADKLKDEKKQIIRALSGTSQGPSPSV